VLVILQENIDTVTVGKVESVGEEDCIKVKTEEDYIQLVRTIKTDDEVSVVLLVCFVVVIYLQMCFCVCWLYVHCV
jgi:hypothetical protein